MATINWNGGNGNWTTAIDWSTGAVPGASDDAVIAAAGGYTVAITSPITVGSIAINDGGATLAINDPGNTVSVNAAVTNGGLLFVDAFGGQGDGGSSLTIGGTLTNSNIVQIGVSDLTAATTVTAQALVNTGNIGITGSATKQATLHILAAAPATWTGAAFLSGDALLEFGGTASITGIASNAFLDIDGPQAFVAAAGVGTGSNSALTGLASNAGTFRLRRGASVTTTGDLTNSGSLQVDNLGGQGDGGSSLTIGGTLTNSNSVQIGVRRPDVADDRHRAGAGQYRQHRDCRQRHQAGDAGHFGGGARDLDRRGRAQRRRAAGVRRHRQHHQYRQQRIFGYRRGAGLRGGGGRRHRQ